jgi:hypothetical protein
MTCLLPLALTALWNGGLQPAIGDAQALRAAHIGVDGPTLLAFFRKRNLTSDDQRAIASLIQDLGSRSYRARRRASAELVSRGSVAVPALRAAGDNPDREIARRAGNALRRIQEADIGPAAVVAAARQLGRLKPAGAVQALLNFLPTADSEEVAEEAVAVLATLAAQNGKPLVEALRDKNAVRRAAAAVALVRGGPTDQRPRLRRLLLDSDQRVRMQVAMALAGAGEKDAVPVLIELLGRLPLAQAYLAQDFLFRIAGDYAPASPLVPSASEREKCKAAWGSWWRAHSSRIDLGRLNEKPRLLGHTMLVLLDLGKIVERDAQGNQRWEVEGFQLPLDAQLLPGNRLLVAEHGGNRVTERNLKGEILWQKQVPQPLMAQRLPTGNTFICTRTEMLEVDRAGKEVRNWASPNGANMARATRLPDGDIACITIDDLNSQYYRLSPSGKQKHTFIVNISTSGGRIDVQPNGHILVPEMVYNRVLEYDREGKVVWMARVRQPVAAVRLANGNTLVTTYSQNRAVELDERGEEVAELTATTRVTRAWRR